MPGIEDVFVLSVTTADLLRNLFVALVCGFIISQFYLWRFPRSSAYPAFTNSLVVLSMITALVIMIIGNNLARAFGLVGAMSIIRFRTAVKDPQDIIFIFFSLAVGMAAGVGLLAVAFMSTLAIGLTAIGLPRLMQPSSLRKEYVVQFPYTSGPESSEEYSAVLEKHCRSHRLMSARSGGENEPVRLALHVVMKDEDGGTRLVDELGSVPGVGNITLFSDQESA